MAQQGGMGSAQPYDSLMPDKPRPTWLYRLLRRLFLSWLLLAVLSGGAVAQETGEAAEAPLGILVPDDLRRAVDQFKDLSAFYGRAAVGNAEGFASRRWAELETHYQDIAVQLDAMLSQGNLRIADLPEGRLRISPDGEVELDERLGGQWLPRLLRFYQTGGESAVAQSGLLLPVLIQALSLVKDSDGWPWFRDHVGRSGIIGPVVADQAARAELARYFFLKDRYLTLSMRRVAEGNPTRRHDWARRQMLTFTAVRSLRRDFAERFGAGPADMLRRDWSDYVALVDGFAVTRGWLMLDPGLRLSQLRPRVEPGEVERAAGEIVARQESAIMAPRAGQRPPGLTARRPAQVAPSVEAAPNLATLVQRAKTAEAEAVWQDEIAAALPFPTLPLRPKLRAGASETAEFRAFAARLKEAMAQPDPRLEIAKRDAALDVAEQRVAALQQRVQELEPVEQEVVTLQQRVQELEPVEQEVVTLQQRVQELEPVEQEVVTLQQRVQELEPVEQEVVTLQQRVQELEPVEQEVATLQQRVQELEPAEQEVVTLQQRVDQLGSALRAREEEAAVLQEQLAEVRNAPEAAIAPAVSRIEERQLYMMGAIAGMFLLTLALWLWRRDRTIVVHEQPPVPARIMAPPLLLKSAPPRAGPRAASAPPPAVIEVPPHDPGGRTAESVAEAQAPSSGHAASPVARSEAEERASWQRAAAAIQAAALGDEQSAASHPIVKALRKGNLPLFELLFSELTGLRSPQLQRIVYGGGGEDLAIVCRAVAVDKLLFGAIYLLTDQLRGGDAETDPERLGAMIDMYDRTAPETAQKVLLKWQRNWGAESPADSSLVE